LNPFDLPEQGSGEPVKTRCPCGAERSESDILCPVLIDVRPIEGGRLIERCYMQSRCCSQCGTLYTLLERHSTQ